jgi:hypothetical protein
MLRHLKIIYLNGKLLFKEVKVRHGKEDFFNFQFNSHNNIQIKHQLFFLNLKCSILIFMSTDEYV